MSFLRAILIGVIGFLLALLLPTPLFLAIGGGWVLREKLKQK